MKSNEISCIFCQIDSHNVVIEENGYKGKQCPKCGLIYISHRPSLDEIVNLYEHDESHISAEGHIHDDFLKRLYAKHNLKIVRSVVQNGALLEVGAGAGYFLDEARKTGFSPHGLEFNPIQADHIRDKLNIPCEESPLNVGVFNGKQFDVVYHCDVISHLFDPISDFKNMNKVMKDGAFLIFETGNLGEVDQKYFKHIKNFMYPDHLFFFGSDNLIQLLKETGFELVRIRRYSILPEWSGTKVLPWIKRSIKRHVLRKKPDPSNGISVVKKQPPPPKSFIKKSIINIERYLRYVLRYKVGCIAPKAHRPQTVIVVARKISEWPPENS